MNMRLRLATSTKKAQLQDYRNSCTKIAGIGFPVGSGDTQSAIDSSGPSLRRCPVLN